MEHFHQKLAENSKTGKADMKYFAALDVFIFVPNALRSTTNKERYKSAKIYLY